MATDLVPPQHAETFRTYAALLEAMARLNRVLDRTLRDECGITSSWFEALLRIETAGGRMKMGELAEQVVLTSGGVTRLIDRLDELGLASREDCPEDRRVSYATITEEGRTKLRQAIDVHGVDLDRHLRSLMSDEERQAIVAVMQRILSDDDCAAVTGSRPAANA